MNGFFSISRQFMNSDMWLSEPFTRAQAWIDLIGLARYTDGTVWINSRAIEAKRGQILLSELSYAKRWRWSRNKVRRFLKELEKIQQIEQRKDNVTTCITVLNYNIYQQKVQQKVNTRTMDGQQMDNGWTMEGTQYNKGNKDNKVIKKREPIEERKLNFKNEILEHSEDFSKEIMKAFFEYWSEHGKRDRLMKFEKQKSFGIKRRLTTWKNNEAKFNGKNNISNNSEISDSWNTED